jgi:antitoxin component YwqK of YwqJK toxin-antitoxin module
MIYRPILIFLSAAFAFNIASAQKDTVFNQTDAKGLKQGYWKKEYPNGKPMYKGFFKDGKPFGEMRRYFESGDLKAIMLYDNKNEHIKTKIFYEDGEPAAEGLYYHEQKDSIWIYFSYYSGTVVTSETYNKGAKDGIEKHFYENSQLSEEIEWKNNLKDGIWNQYFEDGKTKLKALYSLNKLKGLYTIYYPKGNLFIVGFYSDNKRNGKWTFYDDFGKVKSEIVYNQGKADNEKEIMEKDQEYFKMVEQNLGKFQDPTPDDVMPNKGY